MLSYRHAFHAGNFADVLKHFVLVQSLDHLLKKESPILYIDTHAGAGSYRIFSDEAKKTGEFASATGKLALDELPDAFARYREVLAPYLFRKQYPGSPSIAADMLRKQDQLRLYELHPQDNKHLRNELEGNKGIFIEQSDGFASLKALLPVQKKRAIVLIDPSYEVKQEYYHVIEKVTEAYKRSPTSLFLLWYPVVDRKLVDTMKKGLVKAGVKDLHQFEFGIAADDSENYGMTSSGIFAINPPWTLPATLQSVLPLLKDQLAPEEGHWKVERITQE